MWPHRALYHNNSHEICGNVPKTNVTLSKAYLLLIGKIGYEIYVNCLCDLIKKIKAIRTKIHEVIYLLDGVNLKFGGNKTDTIFI